jgi:hypothetical protein
VSPLKVSAHISQHEASICKVPEKARKPLVNDLNAGVQQNMDVAALGDGLAWLGAAGYTVSLDDCNFLKVLRKNPRRQKPRNAPPDYNCASIALLHKKLTSTNWIRRIARVTHLIPRARGVYELPWRRRLSRWSRLLSASATFI